MLFQYPTCFRVKNFLMPVSRNVAFLCIFIGIRDFCLLSWPFFIFTLQIYFYFLFLMSDRNVRITQLVLPKQVMIGSMQIIVEYSKHSYFFLKSYMGCLSLPMNLFLMLSVHIGIIFTVTSSLIQS